MSVPTLSRLWEDRGALPATAFGDKGLTAIPILIERSGLQRGGSNVLFWDGRVEFMPYPGPWPMTEKFIKALESLDELREKE